MEYNENNDKGRLLKEGLYVIWIEGWIAKDEQEDNMKSIIFDLTYSYSTFYKTPWLRFFVLSILNRS